jgi:hypothetical protein
VIRALLDALDERDDAVQEMNGEAQHYSDALSREREEWRQERQSLRSLIAVTVAGKPLTPAEQRLVGTITQGGKPLK